MNSIFLHFPNVLGPFRWARMKLQIPVFHSTVCNFLLVFRDRHNFSEILNIDFSFRFMFNNNQKRKMIATNLEAKEYKHLYTKAGIRIGETENR